ncbi:unnamed protein product [Mytilus coruscus]|uniref:Uncharacterized protein n=1 Tax=Mytilus coruscus TaxID=42192 RepID=A0A6J8EWY1_MYTCO|nr:unnamed protein product [Mytilus coruscus]
MFQLEPNVSIQADRSKLVLKTVTDEILRQYLPCLPTDHDTTSTDDETESTSGFPMQIDEFYSYTDDSSKSSEKSSTHNPQSDQTLDDAGDNEIDAYAQLIDNDRDSKSDGDSNTLDDADAGDNEIDAYAQLIDNDRDSKSDRDSNTLDDADAGDNEIDAYAQLIDNDRDSKSDSDSNSDDSDDSNDYATENSDEVETWDPYYNQTIFKEGNKIHANKIDCPVCGTSRYTKSGRPKRTVKYLPVGPRLARIIGDKNLSQIWQKQIPANSNEPIHQMRDIQDSPEYRNLFKSTGYFAGDENGVVVGLEADGIASYQSYYQTYSFIVVTMPIFNIMRKFCIAYLSEDHPLRQASGFPIRNEITSNPKLGTQDEYNEYTSAYEQAVNKAQAATIASATDPRGPNPTNEITRTC